MTPLSSAVQCVAVATMRSCIESRQQQAVVSWQAATAPHPWIWACHKICHQIVQHYCVWNSNL